MDSIYHLPSSLSGQALFQSSSPLFPFTSTNIYWVYTIFMESSYIESTRFQLEGDFDSSPQKIMSDDVFVTMGVAVDIYLLETGYGNYGY